MIPIGKFGFLVLNLEMAPSGVDVNVHPAKLEVRFVEEQKVFKAVYCAIQDTLLKAELVANTETPITGKFERNVGGIMETDEETKSSITGLFRKISKNSDYDFGSNNVIESIYRSKNSNTGEIPIIDELPKVDEQIQTPVQASNNNQQNTIPKEPMENMDLADKLASIKAQLNQMNAENAKYTNKSYGGSNTNTGYNNVVTFEKPKEEVEKEETKTEIKPEINSSQINNINNTQAQTPNDEQIKNTITELMQMGKNLTAEQIREKIAKIAEENKNKVQNQQNISNEINTNEMNKEAQINLPFKILLKKR